MSHLASWTSAIAPERPPIPRPEHWGLGLAVAAAMLGALAWQYTGSTAITEVEGVEEVIISLGGPAQRLEPPPPELQTGGEEALAAERADDAPPPAPPPQPRSVAAVESSEGRISSGNIGSGTQPVPAPAPPAPPPPAPPPARTATLTGDFQAMSTRAYMAQVQYPQAALRREQSGVGILRVIVARDGRVLDWQLVSSTGHERLDDEIRRVAGIVHQLDPLPSSFPNEQARVDIRITFMLEFYVGRS